MLDGLGCLLPACLPLAGRWWRERFGLACAAVCRPFEVGQAWEWGSLDQPVKVHVLMARALCSRGAGGTPLGCAAGGLFLLASPPAALKGF